MLSMAKKAEIFESKLSKEDLNTLAYIVKLDRDKEVNVRVDKQVYTINQALQTSIAAALFDFTELSIAEVEEILTRSNEYMKDSEEFLIKYGEDWIMKINEIKPKMKEECFNLLSVGKNQQQSVKALGELFKDVPTKDLVNVYKEAKEGYLKIKPEIEKMIIAGLQDIKEGKKDKVAVIKSIQKRFNLTEYAASNIYLSVKSKEYIETCPSHYIPNDAKNKVKLDKKEESQPIAPKKEKESINKPIDIKKEGMKEMFEVVKKEIILKGDFGTYKIDTNGVQAGDLEFKSMEDIEKYEEEQLKQFNKQMEELRAAFAYEG